MAGRATERAGAVAGLTVAGVNDPSAQRALDQVTDAVQQAQEDIRKIRAAGFGPGRLIGRQIFTASGDYTPTTGVTRIVVRMVGGGGGGGGAIGGANVAVGGGGASGVYLELEVAAAAIAGGAVTIGAGGAAGAATGGAGGDGGDTAIVVNGTTYTARGGDGGDGLAVSTTAGFVQGGQGSVGASSAADVTTQEAGEPGVVVTVNLSWSGAGGSNPMGGGGFSFGGVTGAGNTGIGFGGGGSGAVADVANRAGGPGTPGAVLVEEYS